MSVSDQLQETQDSKWTEGSVISRGDVCHFLVGWRPSEAWAGNLFLPRAMWLFITSFTYLNLCCLKKTFRFIECLVLHTVVLARTNESGGPYTACRPHSPTPALKHSLFPPQYSIMFKMVVTLFSWICIYDERSSV